MKIKEVADEKRSLLLPLILTLIASSVLIIAAIMGCDSQSVNCYSATLGIAGYGMFGYLLKKHLISKE